MLPCHPLCLQNLLPWYIQQTLLHFFPLGERTIIAKEDSIQAQVDGPINFSGLLTGIQMIDSCNWEQHNSLGEDSWKHHYMFKTLLISMYGLYNLWKGSSVINFRVLYLLMKQDIDSKLSSNDWLRNEIKGDQGLWSGRKVTDGYCLLSRPLHHSYTQRIVINCWSNLLQHEDHVFYEPPCSLQEAMVLLIGTSYTINLQVTLQCD